MSNIINIWDETTQQFVSIPALKGEKGDTGAPGPAGPQGPQGPKGDPGASTWSDVTGKPFKSLGETLQVDEDGTLNIVIPPEYGRVSYDGNTLIVE